MSGSKRGTWRERVTTYNPARKGRVPVAEVRREMAQLKARMNRLQGRAKTVARQKLRMEALLERKAARLAWLLEKEQAAGRSAGEQLKIDELCSRFAAVMSTYDPAKTGIRNGAVLARASGVSRQAKWEQRQRIAREYREATGGKAGFENLGGNGGEGK